MKMTCILTYFLAVQYPQSSLSAAIENANEALATFLLQVAPKELLMVPNYVSFFYLYKWVSNFIDIGFET
jgi:hypothetical protein